MAADTVSHEQIVDAPPEDVFAFLQRPANHPEIDGSGHVRTAEDTTQRLTRRGDRFGMDMRWFLPYRITNTVTEFEQDRRLAWRHVAGHTWRYELFPEGDGATRVVETFDPTTARMPVAVYRWFYDFPEAYDRQITRTLANLRDRFAG